MTTGYFLSRKIVIEKLDKALSAFLQPYQIKRIAKAEGEADIIKAKAKKEADAINAESEGNAALIKARYEEEINDFRTAFEQKKMDNVQKAVVKAIEMTDNADVSPEPLDPDWFARWIDITSGFSQEHANFLWAKILERELKKPDSVSLRTMDILRNMSKNEGERFAKLCKFIICSDGEMYIACPEQDNASGGMGFLWEDLFIIGEAGLINLQSDICMNFKRNSTDDNCITLSYQQQRIEIVMADGCTSIALPIYPLTQAGKELYPIANKGERTEKYIASVIEFFQDVHKCQVKTLS